MYNFGLGGCSSKLQPHLLVSGGCRLQCFIRLRRIEKSLNKDFPSFIAQKQGFKLLNRLGCCCLDI